MPNDYLLCTDTGADIPWRTAQQEQIAIAQLHYTMDDAAYTYDPGRDADLSAFFYAMRNGAKVGTIPVLPEAFFSLWHDELACGRDVLYIALSSGLSKTFLSAQSAREQLLQEFPNRHIVLVDTRCCSIAQGMLAFEAAHMRYDGASINEVAEWVVENRQYIHGLLLPQTRKFLRDANMYQGGAVGELLGRHVLLSLSADGTLSEESRFKSLEEALAGMAEHVERMGFALKDQIVGITHADEPELAAALRDMLLQQTSCINTAILPMGPITGCYAGPGAVGVAFFGSRRQ